MNALILTPAQATALRAANNTSGEPRRRIEPRLLDDGTYILNADILTDPLFSNATKGWKNTLDQVPRSKAGDKTLEQWDQIDTAARTAKQAEAIPE